MQRAAIGRGGQADRIEQAHEASAREKTGTLLVAPLAPHIYIV
jgi:hypothetical protein